MSFKEGPRALGCTRVPLRVPWGFLIIYDSSIIGPQSLILIIKAPILGLRIGSVGGFRKFRVLRFKVVLSGFRKGCFLGFFV